ncbi:MAG TPA: dihydropteroate synthase [Azospirillum sp.]|nr:dihydropteroate synthase [Azospirillum sp.]
MGNRQERSGTSAPPDPTGQDDRIYVRPLGLTSPGHALPGARPLAGGWLSFDRCEVIVRRGAVLERKLVALGDPTSWPDELPASLHRLSAPRPAFAGIPLDRPRIMGVLNVTPDSFSDGGLHLDAEKAVEHGLAMVAAGADIVDVGAESTRPGALPVPPDEQIRRAIPVVTRLTQRGVVVSMDTRSAAVMRAALDAGAAIINDVSALTHDPESLGVAAAADAGVILMHMRGVPETMNLAPAYSDPALDVFDELEQRVQACEAAGIPRGRILVDPGIGFAKTMPHGAAITRALSLFHAMGCGVLVGFSRKGLVERWADAIEPQARLPGSLAAALVAFSQGVQVVRAHDVAATAQARDVWEALAPI